MPVLIQSRKREPELDASWGIKRELVVIEGLELGTLTGNADFGHA
jgi:hypothetical protein